jgi:hypothetical protein
MAIDTKDPRALAELSGAVYKKRRDRSLRAMSKLRDQQLSAAALAAREVESHSRQLQCIRLYYEKSFAHRLLDFAESVRMRRAVLEEQGQLWKLASVAYDGFMRQAFSHRGSTSSVDITQSEVMQLGERDDTDRDVEDVLWEECSWDNLARIVYRFLDVTWSETPARIPVRTTIRGELITIGEHEAQCWMEVAEGMRVKATIPTQAIRGLELAAGGEFLWDVANKCALLPVQEPESIERRRLRSSLYALKEEFHKDLKHRQTGLEQ